MSLDLLANLHRICSRYLLRISACRQSEYRGQKIVIHSFDRRSVSPKLSAISTVSEASIPWFRLDQTFAPTVNMKIRNARYRGVLEDVFSDHNFTSIAKLSLEFVQVRGATLERAKDILICYATLYIGNSNWPWNYLVGMIYIKWPN